MIYAGSNCACVCNQSKVNQSNCKTKKIKHTTGSFILFQSLTVLLDNLESHFLVGWLVAFDCFLLTSFVQPGLKSELQ